MEPCHNCEQNPECTGEGMFCGCPCHDGALAFTCHTLVEGDYSAIEVRANFSTITNLEETHQMKKTPWKMPEWMEPYREWIFNTGGNTIEDLMNRLDTDKRMSQTNIVVFTMAISVDAQVNLLTRLHTSGLLAKKAGQ